MTDFNSTGLYIFGIVILSLIAIYIIVRITQAFRSDAMDNLIASLPFMDPDSTRFVELFWSLRHRAGKATYGDFIDISKEVNASLTDVISFLEKPFDRNYDSPYLYRGIREATVRDPKCRFWPRKIHYFDCYIVADQAQDGSISINMFGDESEVKPFMQRLEENFRPPKTITINTLDGFGQTGPMVTPDVIFENKAELAHDAFYPYLEGGIDNLIKDFLDSNSSELMLIGDAGTGKSVLARTIMVKSGRVNFGDVSSETAIMDPNLIPWIRSLGNNSIVSVQDADKLVSSRESGNPYMSALLNYAAGAVKNNGKLIIATNLPSLASVDKALVRPGRCFRVIKFRNLMGLDEINNARAVLNLPELNDDDLKAAGIKEPSLTLSEALNFEEIVSGGHKEMEWKTGFH